jgi:hypothetical protein
MINIKGSAHRVYISRKVNFLNGDVNERKNSIGTIYHHLGGFGQISTKKGRTAEEG